MTLAQLKEAEDEFDDEDMRAIETYRYSDSLGQFTSFGKKYCKDETTKKTYFIYRIDLKITN